MTPQKSHSNKKETNQTRVITATLLKHSSSCNISLSSWYFRIIAASVSASIDDCWRGNAGLKRPPLGDADVTPAPLNRRRTRRASLTAQLRRCAAAERCQAGSESRINESLSFLLLWNINQRPFWCVHIFCPCLAQFSLSNTELIDICLTSWRGWKKKMTTLLLSMSLQLSSGS